MVDPGPVVRRAAGARARAAGAIARLQPPRPARIAQWQREQAFPICPNIDDPDGCNVYRNLRFPDGVYENIQQYHEHKATAQEAGG